ncbi:MAG: hypothetical protein AAGD12_12860 [Pseudomonadota bacterium]
MGDKMKKDDVKLRAKASSFNPSDAVALAGRSLPSAVTSAIKDAVKRQKAKELKDPEVKVGLIKGNLYLRLKDGSSHLDDFLLVKNWQDPTANPDPKKDAGYKKSLKDFIDVRMEALAVVQSGEKAVKAEYLKIKEMRLRMLDVLEEAKRGIGYGDRVVETADDIVKDAMSLAVAADKIRKDIFKTYDEHRTFKTPEGLLQEDVSAYTRAFYLNRMKPAFAKAEEYVELCNTAIGQLRALSKDVRNHAKFRDQEDANNRSTIDELLKLLRQEQGAIQAVWGSKTPIDAIAESLSADVGKIKKSKTDPYDETTRMSLVQGHLDNASGRVDGMKNAYSRLKKHLKIVDELAGRVKDLPKAAIKDNEVAAMVKAFGKTRKEIDVYVKECEGHMKKALTTYSTVKKEAAAA